VIIVNKVSYINLSLDKNLWHEGKYQVKITPQSKVKAAFEPAKLEDISYKGWLADRININIEKRLLSLDLDMILDPFVNRPGKQWWAGEHVGKYLHAATYAWQFTGNKKLKERMDSTVDKLISTQLENGYLGTYREKDQFHEGSGLGWDGPVWDVWTHKYNLIGLLTYFCATGHSPALNASRRAADLMYELFATKNRSLRLASAHEGMAATSVLEPIALLFRLTGEPRYLEFSHRIIEAWEDESDPETWMYEDGCQLLSSLLEHGNVYKTANRKAYEMLSNLVGLMELYRIDPDERYFTACTNAWNDIANNRLYMTGTASYFEQFTQDDRLPAGKAAGEGCVTVTWLQLTRHLLELTGEIQYADELERTTYNALLAAQSPRTGEVSYFVPLLGCRDFNGHDLKLTPPISCCSSSIPRGIAMIPTFVSGVLNDKPVLFQYVPGRHVLAYGNQDDRKEVIINISGDYPHTGELSLEVLPTHGDRFPIVLRAPAWASSFQATINNQIYTPKDTRMIEIERYWEPGDTVLINIPVKTRLVPHADKTTTSNAFVRGPQVLAVDTAIETANGIPTSGWWGNILYKQVARQNGIEKEFQLVPFADAGQNKQEYAVLHNGVEELGEGE